MRRIFPALITVLLFCTMAGYLLMTPDDYKTLGQSIVATTLFLSNIFFWRQANYFGAPASENPLLHTWSLAIEEQFYLFYPLLLLLVSKYIPTLRKSAILALCLLSFAASVWLLAVKPSATFYLGPTRFWELLVGGLIALSLIPASPNRSINLMASTLGTALIGYAVLFYSPATRFPGVAALLPVLGAAAIIWSGTGVSTPVHRLIGAGPVAMLGKASYSLYLWHFPLIAFASYVTLGGVSAPLMCAICLAAVLVSFASLHFIERPFRLYARPAQVNRLLMATAAAAMLAVFSGGLLVAIKNGFPSRIDAVAARFLDAEHDKFLHPYECLSVDRQLCPLRRPAGSGAPASSRTLCYGATRIRWPRPWRWSNRRRRRDRRCFMRRLRTAR